jgi:hypothetical protein
MRKHARKPDRGHISRRAFVGGAGLGAGVVAAGGSAAELLMHVRAQTSTAATCR